MARGLLRAAWVVAGLLLAPSAAFACEGGKVLMEDDFSKLNRAWGIAIDPKIERIDGETARVEYSDFQAEPEDEGCTAYAKCVASAWIGTHGPILEDDTIAFTQEYKKVIFQGSDEELRDAILGLLDQSNQMMKQTENRDELLQHQANIEELERKLAIVEKKINAQ